MDKQLEKLQQTKATIAKTCSVLKYILYALFGVYCLLVVIVLGYMAILPDGFSLIGASQPTTVISAICDALAGGLVLLAMGQIAGCVGKEQSPFTPKNSKLLIALGCIIVVSVVCKLFIAPGMDVGVTNEEGMIAFTAAAPGVKSTYIDVRGILEAIACFVLAAIFRYGALLQKETDDMV